MPGIIVIWNERGLLFHTDIPGMGAAGIEPTARWRILNRRDLSLENDSMGSVFRVRYGNRR